MTASMIAPELQKPVRWATPPLSLSSAFGRCVMRLLGKLIAPDVKKLHDVRLEVLESLRPHIQRSGPALIAQDFICGRSALATAFFCNSTEGIYTMDFIKHLQAWVIGETAQGWVMVVAGVLLSIAAFLVLRSDNALLRGVPIPLVLLVAMNLGYGSVLLSNTHDIFEDRSCPSSKPGADSGTTTQQGAN